MKEIYERQFFNLREQRKIILESLTHRLNKLEDEGYTQHFYIKKDEIHASGKKIFSPEALKIDSVYRIEDDSDPTHQTLVYAIQNKKGSCKGTLVTIHGVYSDPATDKIIEKLDRN